MAIYSSYFDESGHPDDSEYLVVAGCVAEVEQWIHFEREWKLALLPFGTEIFHAVDFSARQNAFASLVGRDAEARELLRKLVGIICRRVEKTIGQAVVMAHYKAMDEKYIFSESHGYPYPAACRACVGAVELWASKHKISPNHIQYVFEDGAKHKGQLNWIMERDGLSTPIFQKKHEATPLQAGDLIAWLQNLALVSSGALAPMYAEAIEKLMEHSSDWGIGRFEDPDRFPTVFNVGLRDPRFKYKSIIIRVDGKRRAVVRYWPIDRPEGGKIKKGTLLLPHPKPIHIEEFDEALLQYDKPKGKER